LLFDGSILKVVPQTQRKYKEGGANSKKFLRPDWAEKKQKTLSFVCTDTIIANGSIITEYQVPTFVKCALTHQVQHEEMEGTKPSEKDIVEDNNNKKESRLPGNISLIWPITLRSSVCVSYLFQKVENATS
jgi:hypothetical protein